jgi:hypothetical protein
MLDAPPYYFMTTTAIVKTSKRVLSKHLKSVDVGWNKKAGQLILRNGRGRPIRMGRRDAQILLRYIAAVTKYENHCEHTDCYEPKVPGISFCRFHRIDLLLEGDDAIGMGGLLRE